MKKGKSKNLNKCYEIKDHFVLCGKPKFNEENEVVEWIHSAVKLSEIKTVHQKLNSFIPKNPEDCIFYTYKDEWYICTVGYLQLMDNINIYLNKIGKSHGSEISRDNTRSHSV